jgi:hypothetical protein
MGKPTEVLAAMAAAAMAVGVIVVARGGQV